MSETLDEQLERVRHLCAQQDLKPWEERFLSGGDLHALRAVLEQRDRMREALDFYAEDESYCPTPPTVDDDCLPLVESDRGQIARAAIHPETPVEESST